MIPLPFQCLQRLFPGDYTSFRVNCSENASGNNRDRYVWSIPLILNLQLERHTHALQMIIICELNLCPGAPQRWLRRRLLDWLLWINEVILPLIKICVEASTVLPSTWHYTLQPHAANLELFPWILQKKTAKQSSWFFELGDKISPRCSHWKGQSISQKKRTKWSFLQTGGRRKQNLTGCSVEKYWICSPLMTFVVLI